MEVSEAIEAWWATLTPDRRSEAKAGVAKGDLPEWTATALNNIN